MRKPEAALLAALFALLAAACDKKPDGPPDIRLELGTFKSPLCEIENVRDTFALDEPMSMVVRSDRPINRPGERHTIYLVRLTTVPGYDEPGRTEVDRINLPVDPKQSRFCAAGPKLTPRQFGVQEPGRYEIGFWIDDQRTAWTNVNILPPRSSAGDKPPEGG